MIFARVRRAASALGLLAMVAGEVRAQGRPLEQVLATISSGRDVPAAAEELTLAARRSAEPLFKLLWTDSELSALQRTALELALEGLPREVVLAPLRGAARGQGNEAEREAALTMLARTGTRVELALALELGSADALGKPAPRGRQAGLEKALAAILGREPAGIVELEDLLLRADASTREPVVRALGAGAGEGAAARLAALLWRCDPATKALVLVEIARVASGGSGLDDPSVSEGVRGELGSLDKSLVVLACGALEKLSDHGAVPELIVLLAESDASVRTRAHRALVRLTGVELPADEDAWLAWLDEAFAWWDTRSEACRVALVSGSASEAAAAVLEFAHQRFRRDHVVQALELVFARTDEDVVASVLAVLSAIPDPRARRALQRYRDEAPGELATRVDEAHRANDQRLARAGAKKPLRPPARGRTP